MKKQQNIETTPEILSWYAANFPEGVKNSSRQGVTKIVEAAQHGLEKNPICDMFPDPDQAMNFMLITWKNMWRHSLVSVKGIFSGNELKLLIDIYNGTMLSPMHYGSNSLEVGISDSIALDGMAEKWDVDPEKIIEKARRLTPTQALCLELWANGFWYGGNKAAELDEYVKQLSNGM